MKANTILVSVLAASLTVAGCATYDPYTGEKQVSKTTVGAGVGAVAGAAVGYLTQRDDDRRDRRKGVLIGAGVGALAGGAVGNYMDRQEARLRQQLQGTGVSVTRVGNNLILNMPGNVTFAFARAEIDPGFYDVLKSVSLVLEEYDQTAIEIAGHTDSVGSDTNNMLLSVSRAQSVADYLAAHSIDRLRIDTVGYGESRPIAGNETDAGRAQNRRVELTLVPVTQT